MSLQRPEPSEDGIGDISIVESEANEVPVLNLDALRGTLGTRSNKDELKGPKLEWLETKISDELVDTNPKNRCGDYDSVVICVILIPLYTLGTKDGCDIVPCKQPW